MKDDKSHLAEFARGQIAAYGPQTTGMIIAVFFHTLGNTLPGDSHQERWHLARREMTEAGLVLDEPTDTWTLPPEKAA